MVTGEVDKYNDFEERCWDKFWSKRDKNILMECLEAPVDNIKWKVKEFLDKLEDTYPESKFEIRFVSDHLSYDTFEINRLLKTSIQYARTGTCRSVCAAEDMFYMIPCQQRTIYFSQIDVIVKRDHNPANNAHFVYLMYVKALDWKAKNP